MVGRRQNGPLQPSGREGVVRVALAAMERPREAETLDAVDPVEAQNLLADGFAGEPLLILGAEHRIDFVHLQVLLRRIHNLLVGRSQPVHRLGVGELQHDPVGEFAQPFVFFAPEDKNFVLKESRKSATVEGHSEIFGFVTHLMDNVIIEGGHPVEQGAQTSVIERFFFVLTGQLLAERQGAFPHFTAVKEIDTVQVEGFLQLAVRRYVRMPGGEKERRQRLVTPAQQLGVKLERVGGLCEVVAFQVQVAQLVEIADVHLLAADLLVEIQQVDGAAHPVLAVLIRDDGSVLEEPLHQPGDCADKFQALVAHRRVFLAQFRHQRLEEILVMFVTPSAFH